MAGAAVAVPEHRLQALDRDARVIVRECGEVEVAEVVVARLLWLLSAALGSQVVL